MAKVKESYLDEDEAWMEVSSSESVCSEAPAVEELPKEPEVELTPEEKRNKAFREALAEAALKWPGRTWSRRHSIHRGTMLKLNDEIENINRGGTMMQVMKHCAFGVPPIVIGHHLDDDGEKMLKTMLESTATVEETVIWAMDYEPGKQLPLFKKGKNGEMILEKEPTPEPEPEPESESESESEDLDFECTHSPRCTSPCVPDEPEIEIEIEGVDLNSLMNRIPFMHPNKKPVTWRKWIDIVHEVLDPEGLTEEQYLDVMAARMGGDFLKAMKRMRKEKRARPYIEQYFLGLDRIAAVKPTKARTERKVELMRPKVSQQWGINMGYLVSPSVGLQLVLGEVDIGSPAWDSGLRVGDAIVEVNGWLVARMSHPGTAISVFMAAGNTASVDVVSPFDGTFSQCAAMEAY